MKAYIIRVFLFFIGTLGVFANLLAISDINWKSEASELFFLGIRLVGMWGVGFLAVVFLFALGLDLVKRDRLLIERREGLQIGIVFAIFLVFVAFKMYPFVLLKAKVARYYFGPVSIAYIEAKGNYEIAARRAETLADSKRWSFLSGELADFSRFLRSKALLRNEIEEELGRLQNGKKVADVEKSLEFSKFFARPTFGTDSASREYDRVPPGVYYLESLGVLEDISWKSRKF